MKTNRIASGVTLASLLLATLGALPAAADAAYQAEIRTTSFGIPHIKADNWGSLGFGYGYAYASDNLCVLAREVVAANGQQSLYFGESSGRVADDFFYTLVNSEEFIDGALADISPDAREGIRGFAAGYSQYLADTGVDNLPADCRGQEWVRPIDEIDLGRVYHKLILRASGGAVSSLIFSANPPSPRGRPYSVQSQQPDADEWRAKMATADFSALKDLVNTDELGSNMYALGANATASGKGMLLGNPHFPWNGPLRWYQVHLTIPGELDVMGASLQGVPLVNIGFKNNFAWSHTVSPASRFAFFEVALVPGQPTRYLFDGAERDMGVHPVEIQVRVGAQIETRSHTFYSTVHGWVLDFGPLLGFNIWDTGLSIFALGDANAGSLRTIDQFYRMNIADDLDGFVDALRTTVGLPWVHTVAASDTGTAFYGDISVQPNVTADKIAACPPLVFGGAIALQSGQFVLDGRSTECRFDTDADSPAPGIIGFDALPKLITQDYVTNSNDNHWLSNPDQPLEGFQPPGGPERTARSLRTRLGLVQVEQRLAGTDGQPGTGFTLPTLQEALFGSRNYAAEMLVDDLVQVCIDEGQSVTIGADVVDLTEACALLSNWDKRQRIDSFGVPIFVEFIESAFDALDDNLLTGLWAVPFDVNDPVNTPRGLLDDTPADRARLMQWLGLGVQRLQANGVPLDAAWGDIHYSPRNGVNYPIHGGRDGSGMFSVINTPLGPGGYAPTTFGNSYMQTVTFDDGGVVAEALLSYSQSSDPASPHYADQTALYSASEWNALPFTEDEILADPNLEIITVVGDRDSDGDGVPDSVDNCTIVANPAQRDTDNDGFGNFCDADFSNDGVVNFIDLGMFKMGFGGTDPNLDMNGDGVVNVVDLGLIRAGFFAPPGPAASIPTAVRYTDVQPFLAAKCQPCHTGSGLSSYNFATDYESSQEPAETGACMGLTAGACALVRAQSGEMPSGAGCSGDPMVDAGNAACLTAAEQQLLQDWVSGGQQP